jgi:peptidoglycan/LPS O-acetylase OafA/YrhL
VNKIGSALIEYDGNRKNNFTIIRIILAWLVLYGHGFPIQNIDGIRDPLNRLFQGSTWIGDIAVNGFFAISGFLVTASFVKRGPIDYIISRILRILPALFVCILASVFLLGPMLTSSNLDVYFSKPETYKYLSNVFPFSPNIVWTLPGVFEENARNAINGSLWTLPIELRCYLLLALVGFFGIFKDRRIANTFILVIFLFSIYFFAKIPLLGIGVNIDWARPSLFFLLGVFFYVNRRNVLFDIRLAFLAMILIMFSFGKRWFSYTFSLAFVYLIFYMAYATKFIDTDGKIGDLSYGIYIYAWPVQQLVAKMFPSIKPFGNTILSSIVVAFIAFLSWHYIEKPALNLKKKLMGIDLKRYVFNPIVK